MSSSYTRVLMVPLPSGHCSCSCQDSRGHRHCHRSALLDSCSKHLEQIIYQAYDRPVILHKCVVHAYMCGEQKLISGIFSVTSHILNYFSVCAHIHMHVCKWIHTCMPVCMCACMFACDGKRERHAMDVWRSEENFLGIGSLLLLCFEAESHFCC